MSLVVPRGSFGHKVIEELEHVLVVMSLAMAGRIVLIRFLGRKFLEHGCEEKVYACVVLD